MISHSTNKNRSSKTALFSVLMLFVLLSGCSSPDYLIKKNDIVPAGKTISITAALPPNAWKGLAEMMADSFKNKSSLTVSNVLQQEIESPSPFYKKIGTWFLKPDLIDSEKVNQYVQKHVSDYALVFWMQPEGVYDKKKREYTLMVYYQLYRLPDTGEIVCGKFPIKWYDRSKLFISLTRDADKEAWYDYNRATAVEFDRVAHMIGENLKEKDEDAKPKNKNFQIPGLNTEESSTQTNEETK